MNLSGWLLTHSGAGSNGFSGSDAKCQIKLWIGDKSCISNLITRFFQNCELMGI